MAWTYFLGKYIEKLTGAGRVIDSDHAYIHKGIGFKAYFDLGEVTGDVEYALKFGEQSYAHLKNISLQAIGGTCKVTIRRGTDDNPLVIDSAGSAEVTELLGPHNLNDASGRATDLTITKTPTYDAPGDDDGKGEDWAAIQVLGDGTNQFTSVADTQQNPNEELVLKPDTYYVIKVEKVGEPNPDNVLMTAFWYEEPEGVY